MCLCIYTCLDPLVSHQPIIGCDPHMKSNLETFFQIQYPKASSILVCTHVEVNSVTIFSTSIL